MASNQTLISNSSYTNKDFQAIYPALLDLVKKISYRWDPTISNESDPGVILLKLNAIIADKCNYNIDKNVLECFPLSVTQERNARQLFEQLGYYMHWYMAATGSITMKWLGDGEGFHTIPKFTMVSDDTSSVVYTILDSLPLQLDGTYCNFNVIQGVANSYALNGSTLITAQNLDSNNRLYFNESTVAQNGIFIRNASALNYDEWQRKDNLIVETVSPSSKFYKFGVTLDTNTCYIEFPENAQELINDGIYITYITTLGHNGNIAPFELSKFYNDVTVDGVLLDSSNVQIQNISSIVNGEDTESIDDAYQGYRKVVGTFKTLVTLRDYINAIRQYPNVSNGFVCDKTNDIANELDVMELVNGVDQVSAVSLPSNSLSNTDVTMFPFDLKFYMLYAEDEFSDITSSKMYNQTFNLLEDMDLVNNTYYADNAISYLNDTKSIQQNLNTLLTVGTERVTPAGGAAPYNHNFYIYGNQICFIKNKYPISGTIIPQYRLTDVQVREVLTNIKIALLNNLNSRKIEFGKELDFDDLYSLILKSDDRIKAIMLNDITYQTYAVYLKVVEDGTTHAQTPSFIEVRIDEVDSLYPAISKNLRREIITRSILAGRTPFYVHAEDFAITRFNQTNTNLVSNVTTIDLSGNLPKDPSGESTSATYTVDKNTMVRFLSPRLITTDTYSSYVRYEYNIGTTINANNSYSLGSNEYIAFYWSTSDVDSGSSYAVYGEGSIIKPTFTLNASSSTNNLPQELRDKLSSAIVPKVIKGVTYELDNPSDVESHISTLFGSTLSTEKTVAIQTRNEIQLNNTYLCSWVLNSEDGILFGQGIAERTLESGEYFIYTDALKSSLIILGQGTKLSRDTNDWSTPWECAEYDYSEITSGGIAYLLSTPNALVQIPEGKTLTVTEMEFIYVTEGGEIQLESNNNVPNISINGATIDLSPQTYTHVRYKGKNDVSYTELSLGTSGGSGIDLKWKLSCLGILDISNETPMVLTDGQSLIYNANSNNPTTVTGAGTHIISSESIYKIGNISGINSSLISYTLAADTTTVDYNDTGNSAQIHFNIPEGNESRITEIEVAPTLLNGTYLFTLDASSVSATEQVKFTVYNSVFDVSTTSTGIQNLTVDSSLFTAWESFSEQTTSYEFVASVQDEVVSWSYNSNPVDLSTIGVSYEGTPAANDKITVSSENKLGEAQGEQVVSILLEVSSNDFTKLIIKLSKISGSLSNDKNYTVALRNFYKVEFNPELESILGEDVSEITPATTVQEYIEEQIGIFEGTPSRFSFDYTYDVPEDDLISNPLDPISFFDYNHIYNQFTIAQLVTSDDVLTDGINLFVTNKIR